MKISIYDLLGMIKDGKAPYKILFKGDEYTYEKYTKDYYNEIHDYLFDSYDILTILNDEVEILETTITIKDDKFTGWGTETKCDDEKNLLVSNKIGKIDVAWQNVFDEQAQQVFARMTLNKINEVIDRLNKE